MSASAIACGNSAAHAGTTGSAQDAGNLGSMSRLGRFVALGLPLFNTRSSWSLRPPAPAAAWSKTVKIILQQDRGGRTVNGLWRPQRNSVGNGKEVAT
jgi:hypothetical protein